MKMTIDPLYKKGSVVLISTVVAGILNYCFNPIIARFLHPVEYGELLVVLAIINVITVPAGTISLFVARYVSTFAASHPGTVPDRYPRRMYQYALLVCIAAVAVYVGIVPLLTRTLHFGSSLPLYLVLVSVVPVLLFPVSIGVLQGLQLFNRISVLNVIGAALKIILAVLAAFMGYRQGGVTGFVGVAALMLMVLGMLLSRGFENRDAHEAIPMRRFAEHGLHLLVANILLAVLFNMDLLYVKHYLTADTAGLYASVSLLGKVIFYFGSALSVVLFPLVAERTARNESSIWILKRALIGIVIMTLLGMFVCMVASSTFINLLFGSRYLGLDQLLWKTVLTFGLYTVLYVVSMYLLAVHCRQLIAVLLVGTIAVVTVIGRYHASIDTILSVLSIAFVGMSVVATVFTPRSTQKPGVS